MALLETITSPTALKALPADQLPALAEEIRTFLVAEVSKTGGHLGPNLGVVELTIALHRVFDSPRDTLVFDTGHQSYVHKLLTGRQDFSKLKQEGRPLRLPEPRRVRARRRRELPRLDGAVVGRRHRQGAAPHAARATGTPSRSSVTAPSPAAWPGRRSTTSPSTRRCRSSSSSTTTSAPTPRPIGGLADHLATLRTTRGYERFLDWGKRSLARTPVVGGAMYETLHGVKKGIKDIVAPQGMFEDLGLKYLGPVDGHDEQALEPALSKAKDFGGPVIVHVITQKGRGYQPAIDDEADQFHGVGKINPETGLPLRGRRPHLDRRVQRRDGRHRARPPGRRGPHRRHAHPGGTGRFRRRLP